jgi:hypothetical protein
VKSNAHKFSTFSVVAVALVAAIASYLLIGVKDSGALHADAGVTTEKAAASVGAKVFPTDPKLKIEPK